MDLNGIGISQQLHAFSFFPKNFVFTAHQWGFFSLLRNPIRICTHSSRKFGFFLAVLGCDETRFFSLHPSPFVSCITFRSVCIYFSSCQSIYTPKLKPMGRWCHLLAHRLVLSKTEITPEVINAQVSTSCVLFLVTPPSDLDISPQNKAPIPALPQKVDLDNQTFEIWVRALMKSFKNQKVRAILRTSIQRRWKIDEISMVCEDFCFCLCGWFLWSMKNFGYSWFHVKNIMIFPPKYKAPLGWIGRRRLLILLYIFTNNESMIALKYNYF